MTRECLPNRRAVETHPIEHSGHGYWLSVGRYKDGRIAEVFAQAHKTSSQAEALARDGAILISIALQHGIPAEVMREAVTREEDDSAATVIGAVLDVIKELA